MKLFDREYSKAEIRKLTGNMGQIGGTRHYELSEGSSKGLRAIDINNGSGFHSTVVPDRGLDISRAFYKGVNLVYQSPQGEVNPAFYNNRGSEWLRTFFAGLLTTCGLTNIGNPGNDQGEDLGLHGRYSATPARRVNDTSHWEGDEYLVELSGTVEESVLFGNKMRLERKIKTKLGTKSIFIHDTVENFGSDTSPFTILYHINPGFPLLDEGTELILSSKSVIPYDEASRKELGKWGIFEKPSPDFYEQNFLHEMAGDSEGYAYAAVINRKLQGGLGLYMKFRVDTLPYLTEWKMTGEVDYVAGIEPCNTKCLNRAELRREKILPFLKPGEIKEQFIEIGVLDGQAEIGEFEEKICKLV